MRVLSIIIIITFFYSCNTKKLDHKVMAEEHENKYIDTTWMQREIFGSGLKKVYTENSVPGLRISKQEVENLFLLVKNSEFTFGDYNINFTKYKSKDVYGVITTLSYLAQQGNIDIENYLLDKFEEEYIDVLKNYKKIGLHHSVYGLKLLESFNRLPPSHRKISLLYKFLDLGIPYPKDYYHTDIIVHLDADTKIFNSLLENYENVRELYLDKVFNPVMRKEYFEYTEKYPGSEYGYQELKFKELYPLFLKRREKGALKLVTRKKWPNKYVYHWTYKNIL